MTDEPKEPASRAKRRAVGSKRHQARILALQILYEVDVTEHQVEDVLTRTFVEEHVPMDVREYVERLVRGALSDRATIDAQIERAASAFPIPQLPAIDRNVLRLAIYELLHEPDVPLKAAINEAVELAKRFGGPNSGRFVNGVLGTIAGGVRSDR
jgi:N utilization substance protein B